ncbi:MAG TPA: hypothetical protein VGM90_33835 [Kofleriaceae bacterium]|jgi:hypothetical protein
MLVICPACLQRMEVADVDENHVMAAGGSLCTCVSCKRMVRRDEHRRVVVTEEYQTKLYGYPDGGARFIAQRERGGRWRFRIRGLFYWFFGKRVTITDQRVEVTLGLRRMHHTFPIAHVIGVVVVQYIYLDTRHSMWAPYLAFDGGTIPLAAFSNLDRAIHVASAINRVLIARKPVGDPYRGLLASGDA